MPTATERIQDVTQASSAKPKIALDTCCVQYYISNPPVKPWSDCLDPVFQAALNGNVELYVSNVVVSELLAHVHFAHRHNSGYDPELDFLSIINRHFQILDVTSDVAKAAGRLRGNYIPGDKIALKTPDALIGATSLTSGHTLFITNDAQLANALPAANCVYLRDIALEWLEQQFPSTCLARSAPIRSIGGGSGFPRKATLEKLELCSIRLGTTVRWQRLLQDAKIVATAIGESCVFFVLSQKNGRSRTCRELIFWHRGVNQNRPFVNVIKRLQDHVGFSAKSKRTANLKRLIHGFVFTSLSREWLLQDKPEFISKSPSTKESDAWCAYLDLWRTLRPCLDLPQTTWLHCENGSARLLDATSAAGFLDQARNVLGWRDEKC